MSAIKCIPIKNYKMFKQNVIKNRETKIGIMTERKIVREREKLLTER